MNFVNFLVPAVIINHAPIPRNPCQPSPCGANAQCSNRNGEAICSCLRDYIGSPPQCRPECISSSECPMDKACINSKCQDPCPGSCGSLAQCRVVAHAAMCYCPHGFTGDPFTACLRPPVQNVPTEVFIPTKEPKCSCGANARCQQANDIATCHCLPDYYGNPYEFCRPECVQNSDCPSNKACLNLKCADPCPGACGQNAQCHTIGHRPQCHCLNGYEGNPYVLCSPLRESKTACKKKYLISITNSSVTTLAINYLINLQALFIQFYSKF